MKLGILLVLASLNREHMFPKIPFKGNNCRSIFHCQKQGIVSSSSLIEDIAHAIIVVVPRHMEIGMRSREMVLDFIVDGFCE